VTVVLAANGSDADLTGVTLDNDVSDIDLNGQAATLTVAQAGLGITGAGSYNLTDTASAVANTTATIRNDAMDITVDDTALLSQAITINGVSNSGTTLYDIEDGVTTLQNALTNQTAVDAIQAATTVTANAGTTVPTIDMSGFYGPNTVDLIINGNLLSNNIDGGDGDDDIHAAGGDDVIFGGLGDDTITGGSDNDQLFFSTTQALNGSDTVTDFTTGSNTILFEFGDGGINQTDLRGDGTGYLEVASSGALDVNSGVVVITDSQDDLSQGKANDIANALTDANNSDQFYLVFDNGTDSAIYRVADTDADISNGFDTVELMVTLSGVGDASDTLDSSHFNF
jgi:hypothetical protein